MSLVDRIKGILLDPKGTWPVIDREAATVQTIYVPHVVGLAALSSLASFIGLSIIGVGGFGVSFRVPLIAGLVGMVVGFALALAMVYVLSLIVDALAPTFGGRKSAISALKVVAYGSTAGFLVGLFNLIPSLGMLGLLAALYSIYLIYTGLPVLMKCPPEKALPYTAVVMVCGIVAGVLIGAVTSMVRPGHGGMAFGGAGAPAEVAIRTPQGELKIDTAGLEAMAKKMEATGQQMEAAQKSGNGAAAGAAAAAMVGAMAGTPARTPVAGADLKALLPDSLGGMKRESFEAQSNNAMGVATSNARGVYAQGDRRIELSITDTGGLSGVMAMAGWAGLTQDSETDQKVEKIYKQGTRTIHEEYRKDGSQGEVTVLLPNGVLVAAEGAASGELLKKAVESLDLAKLEALK